MIILVPVVFIQIEGEGVVRMYATLYSTRRWNDREQYSDPTHLLPLKPLSFVLGLFPVVARIAEPRDRGAQHGARDGRELRVPRCVQMLHCGGRRRGMNAAGDGQLIIIM